MDNHWSCQFVEVELDLPDIAIGVVEPLLVHAFLQLFHDQVGEIYLSVNSDYFTRFYRLPGLWTLA